LVFTTALSAQLATARSRQINDLRKQKSCGSIRIGEVRLAGNLAGIFYETDPIGPDRRAGCSGTSKAYKKIP
jgi:hypothetical protein